jgi:hypothetical protein
LKALPIMIVMSGIWAIGEFIGYLTGHETGRLTGPNQSK